MVTVRVECMPSTVVVTTETYATNMEAQSLFLNLRLYYHQYYCSKCFILHFLFCSPKRFLENYLVENIRKITTKKWQSHTKETYNITFFLFLLTIVVLKLNSKLELKFFLVQMIHNYFLSTLTRSISNNH